MHVLFAVVLLVASFGDISALGCDGSWTEYGTVSMNPQSERILSCEYDNKCVEFSFELEDQNLDDNIDILVTSNEHCNPDGEPFDELMRYTTHTQDDKQVWQVYDQRIEHKVNKFCVIFKCDWPGLRCDEIKYRSKFNSVTCAVDTPPPPPPPSPPPVANTKLITETYTCTDAEYDATAPQNTWASTTCGQWLDYAEAEEKECGKAPQWDCDGVSNTCTQTWDSRREYCWFRFMHSLNQTYDAYMDCENWSKSIGKGLHTSEAYHPADCDMPTDKFHVKEEYKCGSNKKAYLQYTLTVKSGEDPEVCTDTFKECVSDATSRYDLDCAVKPRPASPPPSAGDVAPTQSGFTYRYFDNPSCEGDAKATDSVESGKRSTIPTWYIPDASSTNYMSIDQCKGKLCIVNSDGKETCTTNEFSYAKFCRQSSDGKRSFNVKECVDAQASSRSSGTHSTPGALAVIASLASLLLTFFTY